MAEADFLGTALAVFIPLTAALAVLLLLPRWVRSRAHRQVRIGRREESSVADQTFNGLITVQAIARDLKERGLESPRANEMLQEAWMAYEESRYAEAEELAGEARAILAELRPVEAPEKPIPVVEVEAIPESKPILGTEYPRNYLQARFMVSMVKDAIGKGSSKKKKEARKVLKEAEEAFEGERYTEALSLALSARRTLEGRKEDEVEASRGSCPSCGEIADPDDDFCGKCGASLVILLECPQCGHKTEGDDKFCRKCGAALTPLPKAS